LLLFEEFDNCKDNFDRTAVFAADRESAALLASTSGGRKICMALAQKSFSIVGDRARVFFQADEL
jgi:hypothetical protein